MVMVLSQSKHRALVFFLLTCSECNYCFCFFLYAHRIRLLIWSYSLHSTSNFLQLSSTVPPWFFPRGTARPNSTAVPPSFLPTFYTFLTLLDEDLNLPT